MATRFFLALPLALLLLLDPIGVLAATYYVGVTGNDGNSCAAAQNPTTRKRTLNNVISTCMGGGDTLLAGSGIYSEKLNNIIPSGSAGAPTTLRSEVPLGAVIQPPAGGGGLLDGVGHVGIDSRQYITIDGFVLDAINTTGGSLYAGAETFLYYIKLSNHITIQNGEIKNLIYQTSPPRSGNAIVSTSNGPTTGHHNTYRNLSIHDLWLGCSPNCLGAESGYAYYVYGDDMTIENNHIYNNGSYSIHNYENPDAGSMAANRLTIRNNNIHHNGYIMLITTPGSGSRIYNNLIHNNNGVGLQIGGFASPTDVQIFNNTIVGNTGACITTPSGNGQFRNNICYQNSGGNSNPGGGFGGSNSSNNLNGTNPLFRNAGAGDFTLLEGSPAIDTGTCTGAPATDYAGIPRPQPVTGACDMGAYEKSTTGRSFFVSTAGNDGNSCAAAQNPTTSKRTPVNAAGCLNGGDTLILGSGTYVGQWNNIIPSGSSGAPTTIRSEVPLGAIIQHTSPDGVFQPIIVISGRTQITLDGLTVDGTAGGGHVLVYLPGSSYITVQNSELRNLRDWAATSCGNTCGGMGITTDNNAHHLTYRNNHIHDLAMGSPGSALGATCIYVPNPDVTVEGNHLHHCAGHGIHNYYQGGVGASRGVFHKNVIHHNRSRGILLGSGDASQAYNNVVYGNYACIQMGGYGNHGSNLKAYHNTCYANNGSGGGECIHLGSEYGSTSNPIVRNNICHGHVNNTIVNESSSGLTASNNLLGTDPLFTNPGAGDFTLQEGSPAIDAGVTVSGITTDQIGTPRPQPPGGAPDIGAIEWLSSSDPPNLPAQMLAHWRLDELTSTTAADATGNGHTGTLVDGPAWVPGRYGRGALLFNGSTQYVTIAGSDLQLATFSLTAWAKPATCPHHTYQDILTRGGTDPNFSMFLELTPVCELIAGYWNGSGYAQYLSPAPVRVGVWSHLAATYDGTTIRLFINGTEVFAGAGVGTPVVLTAPTSIGRAGGNDQWYFAGMIDDPRIYNFALDAVALKYLYTTTAGKPRRRAVVQ